MTLSPCRPVPFSAHSTVGCWMQNTSQIQHTNVFTPSMVGVAGRVDGACGAMILTPCPYDPITMQAVWTARAGAMYVPLQAYCMSWPNASVTGCPADQRVMIHPQYDGYHGQDINQADVALMQWPLHADMTPEVADADLAYYAKRSSGADTKGFYTGDSSQYRSKLYIYIYIYIYI